MKAAAKSRTKVRPGALLADLREACVQAAREVIAERGVEGLSMRDVARRLGISHQAPYRHFESRDHLLAEIMRLQAEFPALAQGTGPTIDMVRVMRSETGEDVPSYESPDTLAELDE